MKKKKAPKAPKPAKVPKPPKTPKPLEPATDSQWKMRLKLEELASTGVEGERVTAAEKLAKLITRADWSGPRPIVAQDLFFGVQVTKTAAPTPVATFDVGGGDVASWVQWALSTRFELDGVWKAEHANQAPTCTRLTLWLNVDTASVHALAHVARSITAAMIKLLDEFQGLGATAADRRLFMRGLYDGMMADERRPGEALPPRAMPIMKRRGKRDNTPAAPVIAVHPYSIALELGRGIRMTLPLGELVRNLHDATHPGEARAAA